MPGKVDTLLNKILGDVKWGEFTLGDLFDVATGRDVIIGNVKNGNIPLISHQHDNNGISKRITQLTNRRLFDYRNTLSLADRGVFLATTQDENFHIGTRVKALTFKDGNKSLKVRQFIVSCINKLQILFLDYASNATDNLPNLQIKLPTRNGKIDFEFMENFIAELETKHIAELEVYLTASGLKDYTLTAEEKRVLDDFENGEITWGEFRIGELFEKLNLKNYNKLFEKMRDTSPTKTDEFNLPLVNAKLGDNGIMFYGRENDFDSAEMTIDVISNGAIATGTVYAQPYKTGVLWDAYLLRPKVINISKQKLLYLTTSLEKSIKKKFGWDNKAVWSKVQYELISLPTQNKQPDYAIMETLISAIQKLVIKDVVLYVDEKSHTTEVF